jgi:hypothetical protein
VPAPDPASAPGVVHSNTTVLADIFFGEPSALLLDSRLFETLEDAEEDPKGLLFKIIDI